MEVMASMHENLEASEFVQSLVFECLLSSHVEAGLRYSIAGMRVALRSLEHFNFTTSLITIHHFALTPSSLKFHECICSQIKY